MIGSPYANGPAETEEDREDEGEDVPAARQNRRPSRRARNHHRVNVVFLDEEADLVRRVLGRIPAAQIVEMCEYWERHDIEEKLLDEEEAAEAA